MKPAAPYSLLKIIVLCCGAYLCAGMGHLTALWLQCSYWLNLLLVLVPALAWICFAGRLPGLDGKEKNLTGRCSFLIVSFLTLTAALMIKAHGAYDAWLHWNSLARYMSSPDAFLYLQQPDSIWHADYPPGLPAFIGFCWRTLGSDPEWVPRSISFLFYLAIVLLLCQEAGKVPGLKGLWLAVLAIFALNFECLSQGLNQYADVPLALFLLLVFMLFEAYDAAAPAPFLMVLTGFMLGGCMLFKNEGIMLAICVLLVYPKTWARMREAGCLLCGLLLPVAILLAYKHYIPAPNDLITHFDAAFWHSLADQEKYLIIGKRAIRVIGGRYPLPLLFAVWAFWKLRKVPAFWKSRILLTLLLCFAGFVFTYLTTRYDIVWLTNTSFNRILMQLLPSFIYFLIRTLHKMPPQRAEMV